jgi:hypothetical protein
MFRQEKSPMLAYSWRIKKPGFCPVSLVKTFGLIVGYLIIQFRKYGSNNQQDRYRSDLLLGVVNARDSWGLTVKSV